MSRPIPGHYVIYNRVLSPTGQKLAITFHGDNHYATVEPYSHLRNQVWKIENYDANTQAIIPVEAANLQAGWGDEGVKILPAHSYVWTIRSSPDGFTIQDGGRTANWGVTKGHAVEHVTITKDQGGPNQRWVFERSED